MAVSAEDSSWTYRFHSAKGGIRALSISALPEQSAPDSVQYRHGEGIIERYLVKSRGVEQQFLLPGPYTGGDVLLTGSVETDLVPEVFTSFEGIAFRRGDETVLFYGDAKAVDADGKTALLEERWADGELTIVVPVSFLAVARFPVLVDPYIGAWPPWTPPSIWPRTRPSPRTGDASRLSPSGPRTSRRLSPFEAGSSVRAAIPSSARSRP